MPNTMTAIGRAEDLLAAATDGPWPYDCLRFKVIRRWLRRTGAQRPEADTKLASLAPDTLRVLIVAAEALAWIEDDDRIGAPYGGAAKAAVLKALAEVKKLFPEESDV